MFFYKKFLQNDKVVRIRGLGGYFFYYQSRGQNGQNYNVQFSTNFLCVLGCELYTFWLNRLS